MQYFLNAKARFNIQEDWFEPINAFGPGFTVHDDYTMESERARYSEARMGANKDRKDEFPRILDEQDYDSILVFAPETERCYCGCWRMNHQEPFFTGSRWVYECKCKHGSFQP